jgi:two-component system, cell cycle sensor histidine kinase and response regulator CckA
VSDESYRQLFEHNPSPMWVFDLGTLRFLAVNEAALRVYGYSRDEFLELTIPDVRPLDGRSSEDLVVSGVCWHLRKDGSEIEVEVTSQALSFEGRDARLVQALDLTARNEAEGAMRESESRYRDLIENAHDLIATVDLDHRLTSVNAAFARALGYTREELNGRLLTDFVPVEARDDVRDAGEAKVGGTAAVTTYEHELIARSGRRIAVEVASRLIEKDGRPTGFQAICRDVSERRRTAEELRASEERFRLVVEHSRDMITLIEADGTISYASPSHEATLGVEPGGLVGRNGAEFLHPDDRERMAAELRAAFGGDVREAVARLRHTDGTYVTVEGVGSPIRDGRGNVTMVVSSSRDIGERLRTAELEQRLHQSRRLEAVGRLAGGVAHDFNNLLTAMNGYGDLALARLAEHRPDSELREYVEQIRLAGDKAATLTSQLLALSRRQVLQPTVLELNRVVREFVPMLRRLLGDDVTVEAALAEGIGAVFADEGQLGQVIVNLAVNARDAMPGGGTLTISTADVTLDDRPGDYVRLAFADTGRGIPAEIIGNVFEPFFTTKPQGEGTGLGLATVLGIVEQSDGYVSVSSPPGEGATLEVLLPRTRKSAAEPERQPPSDATARGERLLLVEDNDAVRGLMSRVLESSGYALVEAASPREALELAATTKEPIDLLVTDVVMPGMNGRQLSNMLREERPDLPVLYISGYTDEAMISRGLLPPGTAFLQKPFSVDQLQRALREILDSRPALVPAG